MALHKLERRYYGRKSQVSIKYQNLHSFKEGLIVLCHQNILEKRRITHLHGSAHFAIPLNLSNIINISAHIGKIHKNTCKWACLIELFLNLVHDLKLQPTFLCYFEPWHTKCNYIQKLHICWFLNCRKINFLFL